MLRQLFHIKNDSGGEAAQQVLAVRVGAGHCGFAITNKAADQLYELAYYAQELTDENPLEELSGQQGWSDQSFYEVLISYDHPQSSLVPSALYQPDKSNELLRALHGVNGTSVVIAEKVSDWQLYNVYAVPVDLYDWVKKKFPAAKCWHQYSVSLKQLARGDAGSLLVDFRQHDFTVTAYRENKLLLAQTFEYSNPADVVYALLSICRQFELSQEQVRLSLSGLIDQQSALYHDLYQYFLQIGFREAAWSKTELEYPAHFFTSFNDLARCVS